MRGKANRDAVGDLTSQLALHGENVADIQVVGLCPQMAVGSGTDELGGHANAIAGPHYRSLDQGIDAQFTRDLGGSLVRASVRARSMYAR